MYCLLYSGDLHGAELLLLAPCDCLLLVWSGQRDSNPCRRLGRPELYQLSYARSGVLNMRSVARFLVEVAGIEPASGKVPRGKMSDQSFFWSRLLRGREKNKHPAKKNMKRSRRAVGFTSCPCCLQPRKVDVALRLSGESVRDGAANLAAAGQGIIPVIRQPRQRSEPLLLVARNERRMRLPEFRTCWQVRMFITRVTGAR